MVIDHEDYDKEMVMTMICVGMSNGFIMELRWGFGLGIIWGLRIRVGNLDGNLYEDWV